MLMNPPGGGGRPRDDEDFLAQRYTNEAKVPSSISM
jgi:hypothetical protein